MVDSAVFHWLGMKVEDDSWKMEGYPILSVRTDTDKKSTDTHKLPRILFYTEKTPHLLCNPYTTIYRNIVSFNYKGPWIVCRLLKQIAGYKLEVLSAYKKLKI